MSCALCPWVSPAAAPFTARHAGVANMAWHGDAQWGDARPGWSDRSWGSEWSRTGKGTGKSGKGKGPYAWEPRSHDGAPPTPKGAGRGGHITVEAALDVIQRQLAERDALERLRGVLQPSLLPLTAHAFPPSGGGLATDPMGLGNGAASAPSQMTWPQQAAQPEPSSIYAREAASAVGSLGSALSAAAASALGHALRCAARSDSALGSPPQPGSAPSLFQRVGALLAPSPRTPPGPPQRTPKIEEVDESSNLRAELAEARARIASMERRLADAGTQKAAAAQPSSGAPISTEALDAAVQAALAAHLKADATRPVTCRGDGSAKRGTNAYVSESDADDDEPPQAFGPQAKRAKRGEAPRTPPMPPPGRPAAGRQQPLAPQPPAVMPVARGPARMPTEVSPTLHKDFLAWVGCSGNLPRTLPRDEWLATVSKRFSKKGWQERLRQAGLTDVPDAKPAMLETALRHFMTERGSPAPARSAGA